MPDPEVPTQPVSSPAPDAAAASSAEGSGADAQQASGSAPPPTSQPAELKPWNLPPEQRWEELRRERDEARRAYQEVVTRLQTAPPPAPASPAPDPWAGLVDHPEPATAQFWQQQQRLLAHERERAKQEAIQSLQPVIDAGLQELARMSTSEFRRQNPEIKPGSEEERLVVAYMNGAIDGVRHTPESAKRNALYDRLETENRALKGQRQMVQTKVAANASESSAGMPAANGLPSRPPDWRERVREAYRKGGDLADVANAIGMRRTP